MNNNKEWFYKKNHKLIPSIKKKVVLILLHLNLMINKTQRDNYVFKNPKMVKVYIMDYINTQNSHMK